MKNALESIGNRAGHTEQRISELVSRNDTNRRGKQIRYLKMRRFYERYSILLEREILS